jgi:hypothetical protein
MPDWPKNSPPNKGVAVISYNPLPYENLDLGFSSRLLGPYYQVMLQVMLLGNVLYCTTVGGHFGTKILLV